MSAAVDAGVPDGCMTWLRTVRTTTGSFQFIAVEPEVVVLDSFHDHGLRRRPQSPAVGREQLQELL